MSPSKQAKAAGLKNLLAMSEATGWPVSTLNDMHRNYPKRFTFLVASCVALGLAIKPSDINQHNEG